MITAGVWNLITGGQAFSWSSIVVSVYVALGVSQICAWLGLYYFWRAQMLDGRVVILLWVMGALAALGVCFTWAFLLALIPLVPPVVGSMMALRTRLATRA